MDPVLICGAGPTGLSLAIFLRAFNVPFRIIDKNEGILELSRALALQPRTLEIFDRLGFVEPFLKAGRKLSAITMYIDGRQSVSASYSAIDSKYTYPLLIAQNVTESILIKELKKQRVSIDRGIELISFEEQKEYIEATLKDKRGHTSVERYSFIIGSDGAHSTVRHNLNVPFKGSDYSEGFALADLNMKCLLNPSEMHIFPSAEGAMAIFPFVEEDKFRIVVSLPIDKSKKEVLSDAGKGNTQTTFTESDLSPEQMATYVRERGLEQFSFQKVDWLSNFKIHRRLAKKWLTGRALLAGDAAHIHSPMGGQGMNTGIQDAWNLAWKLSFHLKHDAPVSWLKTYESERRAIGKKVLQISNALTQMALLSCRWLRALRNCILTHLGTSVLAPKAAKRLSQIYFKYPKNPLCARDFFPSDGLEVGTNVFNRPLTEGSLFDYLDPMRFTLLIFAKASRSAISKGLQLKKELECELLKCEVLSVTPPQSEEVLLDGSGKCHTLFGATTEKMVLIRPDRYIAWQGEGVDKGLLNLFLKSSKLDICLTRATEGKK